MAGSTFVKGWPSGSLISVEDGSIKLLSSCTVGTRQSLRPPVLLDKHRCCAHSQSYISSRGDRSHMSPVLLSLTASLLNSVRTVKRVTLSGVGCSANAVKDTLTLASTSPLIKND